jgi:hypothetical protein
MEYPDRLTYDEKLRAIAISDALVFHGIYASDALLGQSPRPRPPRIDPTPPSSLAFLNEVA